MHSSRPTIPPPSTIGVLGSGQLGRMFAMAARQMGYGVAVFSPDHGSPAGAVADREVSAPYEDLDAARRFAESVDVVTFEFENVPFATAEAMAGHVPVRPSGGILHLTQNRLREKRWLQSHGFPVAPFHEATDPAHVREAVEVLGGHAIAKTSGFGYDGKGQMRLSPSTDPAGAWGALGSDSLVIEQLVEFECELSVIVARGLDGSIATYPLTRNDHQNHILDVSSSPASVAEHVEREALELAGTIATRIGLVGVMGVELFLTSKGTLLVNELAPRPHNSGHWTVGGARTSQFEQQVRAICGLPLGATGRVSPVAMANLLGDLWSQGVPDWSRALADHHVQLHLYGKREARPGRKMGHLTAFGSTAAEAVARVRAARAALSAS